MTELCAYFVFYQMFHHSERRKLGLERRDELCLAVRVRRVVRDQHGGVALPRISGALRWHRALEELHEPRAICVCENVGEIIFIYNCIILVKYSVTQLI